MAALNCEICGGKIMVQAGGQFGECENCGTAYTLDRIRELYAGIKVSQTGSKEDVEQWKALLNTYLKTCDFPAAEGIVNKILEASPSDPYARDIYEKLQDWKFMEIKNGVLQKYTGLNQEVVIPDGVKSIGDGAFKSCNVTSVHIPNSVTSIGNGAFDNCINLVTIKIPSSVANIGVGAFSFCSNLTSIDIPDGVSDIANGTFSFCQSLVSINLPNSVSRIGNKAFGYCAALEKVVIPVGVTSIDRNAFQCCKSLISLTIPDGVTIIEANAFSRCSSLTEINIPDSVTEIGSGAFSECDALVNVTAPARFDNFFPHGKEQAARLQRQREEIKAREEMEQEKRRIERRRQRVCQYCGGPFGGLLRYCQKCGRKKDY